MSFHISQRFIDELLEEDCPYMDLTVEALGIGREPGLLTCHPKAACVVAGVEVAARLLESSGCRVACEAASGDRLEAGQVFLRAEGSAGAIHRSLKIAQNVMEYSSGIATRAAGMLESARKGQSPCAAGRYPQAFPWDQTAFACGAQAGGAIAHRLGLSDSLLVFDQHRVFTGGLDGFARPGVRVPQGVSGTEAGRGSRHPGGSPPAGTLRASIPSNANVLPVRILKKRYAGSRPSTPPFRCSPPEA